VPDLTGAVPSQNKDSGKGPGAEGSRRKTAGETHRARSEPSWDGFWRLTPESQEGATLRPDGI